MPTFARAPRRTRHRGLARLPAVALTAVALLALALGAGLLLEKVQASPGTPAAAPSAFPSNDPVTLDHSSLKGPPSVDEPDMTGASIGAYAP